MQSNFGTPLLLTFLAVTSLSAVTYAQEPAALRPDKTLENSLHELVSASARSVGAEGLKIQGIEKAWAAAPTNLAADLQAIADAIHKLGAHKPAPATIMKRLTLLGLEWLKGSPPRQNDLVAVQNWIGDAAMLLPHVGRGAALETLLNMHPEYGRSENADVFLNVTNCLCTYYEETNQEAKCKARIKLLASHPHPNNALRIYLLIRENRLSATVRDFPSVVKAMAEAKELAEKTNRERLPWIELTVAISALYTGRYPEAMDHFEQVKHYVAETQPDSWYRFYPAFLEGAVLIHQNKLIAARRALEDARLDLVSSVRGSISELAWIDLHRLILAVQKGDRPLAKAIYSTVLDEVAALPSISYIEPFADAFMDKLEGGSGHEAMKRAEMVLGKNNASLVRLRLLL